MGNVSYISAGLPQKIASESGNVCYISAGLQADTIASTEPWSDVWSFTTQSTLLPINCNLLAAASQATRIIQ